MDKDFIIDPSMLTEGQREALWSYYKMTVTDMGVSPMVVGFARRTLLVAIFGKDFFKEKGE